MAYLTKLFQPQAQKSLSSQIGQFFRGYPSLTILEVSTSRTSKGTSVQVTATANGTRHFAAEFAATSLQTAAAQVQAFFVANPSVVPVKTIDISPPKHSSARERLLVIYSQALAVAGGALPQGALSAGVVGDAQLLGAYGEPRGLVSLRNVGDAAWPLGGRGVAWRSALTGQWSGIGERVYTGAAPAYTSTAPLTTTTRDPYCCGGAPLTYPTTVPATVVNTSSTTAFPVSAPSSTPAWSTCCTPGSGTTTSPGYTVPATAWVTAGPVTSPTCPTYTVPVTTSPVIPPPIIFVPANKYPGYFVNQAILTVGLQPAGDDCFPGSLTNFQNDYTCWAGYAPLVGVAATSAGGGSGSTSWGSYNIYTVNNNEFAFTYINFLANNTSTSLTNLSLSGYQDMYIYPTNCYFPEYSGNKTFGGMLLQDDGASRQHALLIAWTNGSSSFSETLPLSTTPTYGMAYAADRVACPGTNPTSGVPFFKSMLTIDSTGVKAWTYFH